MARTIHIADAGTWCPQPEVAAFRLARGLEAERIIWSAPDMRWKPLYERSDPRVSVIHVSEPSPSADATVKKNDLGRTVSRAAVKKMGNRWIEADPQATAKWRARLPAELPIVGMTWKKRRPYFSLTGWARALADCPPATFVCVRSRRAENDIAELRAGGIKIVEFEDWNPLESLEDAFSLIDACDAVVFAESYTHSEIHMIKALGKTLFGPEHLRSINRWRAIER